MSISVYTILNKMSGAYSEKCCDLPFKNVLYFNIYF